MTNEEAIKKLKEFKILHTEQAGWDITTLQALDIAIKALEQEPMRDATPEERKAVNDYIKSISKPTGVKFDFGEEQEVCEDYISRQAALDAVRKNTFRLTFAEEQGCKDHVAWSAEAVYSDAIKGALLELPPVTPQHTEAEIQKMQEMEQAEIEKAYEMGKEEQGHWVNGEYCSECGCDIPANIIDWRWQKDMDAKYCPNCGIKMAKSEEV